MATTKKLSTKEYKARVEAARAATGYDPASSPVHGKTTLDILATVLPLLKEDNSKITTKEYTEARTLLVELQRREATKALTYATS